MRYYQERLVVVNHGWQSEATDGSKGGWELCFLEWLQWLQPQLLDVVWCSGAVCSCVVIRVVCCSVVGCSVV